MIAIVFGLPGSGKSHFGSWFANLVDAEYISSDRLRKEIHVAGNYSDQEKSTVYNEMLERMKTSLRENRNMVIDATFYKEAIRKKFMQEAGSAGHIVFIEIRADETTISERLKRKRAFSDADFEVYKKIKGQFEPMEQPHLVLQSTNDNLPEMLQKAVSYLHVNDD
jgi:predicted kinase